MSIIDSFCCRLHSASSMLMSNTTVNSLYYIHTYVCMLTQTQNLHSYYTNLRSSDCYKCLNHCKMTTRKNSIGAKNKECKLIDNKAKSGTRMYINNLMVKRGGNGRERGKQRHSWCTCSRFVSLSLPLALLRYKYYTWHSQICESKLSLPPSLMQSISTS